jgi:hypothetical protein
VTIRRQDGYPSAVNLGRLRLSNDDLRRLVELLGRPTSGRTPTVSIRRGDYVVDEIEELALLPADARRADVVLERRTSVLEPEGAHGLTVYLGPRKARVHPGLSLHGPAAVELFEQVQLLLRGRQVGRMHREAPLLASTLLLVLIVGPAAYLLSLDDSGSTLPLILLGSWLAGSFVARFVLARLDGVRLEVDGRPQRRKAVVALLVAVAVGTVSTILAEGLLGLFRRLT